MSTFIEGLLKELADAEDDEMKSTNYACDHEPLPICPHCGVKERDAWEINFGPNEDTTTSCGSCGRDYRVSRHVRVTYSTAVLE